MNTVHRGARGWLGVPPNHHLATEEGRPGGSLRQQEENRAVSSMASKKQDFGSRAYVSNGCYHCGITSALSRLTLFRWEGPLEERCLVAPMVISDAKRPSFKLLCRAV